ncbi:hypothetical protein BGZ63DRAFT_423869 [Mariannaea sp. PMI_226]|nr:hypothetical protein BGZ63DRAFT_423869 [Mariannaea sp. PMI_226]
MDTSISDYIFDDEGMTWITCNMCSAFFSVPLYTNYEGLGNPRSKKCVLCHGTKLLRVSHEYLVNAMASVPQNSQGQSSVSRGNHKRDKGQGPSSSNSSSSRGVYNRSS